MKKNVRILLVERFSKKDLVLDLKFTKARIMFKIFSLVPS